MRDAITTLFLFGNHAVSAALVLGLFWAAVARPSRIRKPVAFQLAALLTGLSFIANLLVPLALIINSPEDERGRSQGPKAALYFLVIPPVLDMLAIYLGVLSVMESYQRPKTELGTAPDPAEK